MIDILYTSLILISISGITYGILRRNTPKKIKIHNGDSSIIIESTDFNNDEEFLTLVKHKFSEKSYSNNDPNLDALYNRIMQSSISKATIINSLLESEIRLIQHLKADESFRKRYAESKTWNLVLSHLGDLKKFRGHYGQYLNAIGDGNLKF